ncbi:MAG: hypothetical protein ACXVAU_12095 [Mucilaginibacter sp.]
MEEFNESKDQHKKKAMPIKSAGDWLFIAGVLLALIIAVVAGLHYFRTL